MAEQSTRERILDHALKRFNEDGLEAVGVRDIARELELSPGNVSYHFPKKIDLIDALGQRLSKGNTDVLEGPPPADLTQFMELYRHIFQNQYAHRCLIISLVDLFQRHDAFREGYQARQKARWDALHTNLASLVEHEVLTPGSFELEIAQLALLARFWLSEATVAWPDTPVDRVIEHYLHMVAAILAPRATNSGSAQLRPYLNGALLGA